MDEDTAFWAAMAAECLGSLFAAAMLAGLDARAVAEWICHSTFAEPGSILRAHGMDADARQLARFGDMPLMTAESIKAAMLRQFACLGPA